MDMMPRKVEMVKSDERGEFEGMFGALYTREKINQEVMTTDTLELNGAAESQIVIIAAAGLAAREHTSVKLYPN